MVLIRKRDWSLNPFTSVKYFSHYATGLPLEQEKAQCQFLSEVQLGFNLEFSFSYTGCYTNIKEPSMPYYLLMAGMENSVIHTFYKGICAI